MSLVERALKKIQESRAGAPQPKPGMHGGANEHPPAMGAGVQRASIQPLDEPPRPARIVHIDREALRRIEMLPSVEQERQIAHEYRQIKRPLIDNAFRKGDKASHSHLIMVSSALPGDGKTFTSVNLALSLALEKDLTVLLVDADVAKPHVSRLFNIGGERGLLDLLRDEALNVETVILPTDVPRLSILPAGAASDTATELLASARMERILSQISACDSQRIVLLDSPPLLLTSESRILASIAGQIVLVVRAGVTPQRAVLDALDLLGEGKSVGLVLNQSDEASRSGYYGYYAQSPVNNDG